MASYTIVQLSDLHLTSRETLSVGTRPRENLVNALELLKERRIRPDVYLLTGDLADEGELSCYEDLDSIMEATGLPVVYLPGNHDNRQNFRRGLLHQAPDDSPIDQVHWYNGLRIVSLDSTVPGSDWGMVGKESLDFLAEVLKSPAPDGTILALHHPPVDSLVEQLTEASLRNRNELADAISGSDVRLVACGHYHHEARGAIGKIPLWISPAVSFGTDTTSPVKFRPMLGSAISLIEIDGPGQTIRKIDVPASRASSH